MPLRFAARMHGALAALGARGLEAIERRLEAERDQLAPWFVVLFGAGIALGFAWPEASARLGAGLCAAALALAGRALPGRRLGRVASAAGIALALGLAAISLRLALVAAPRLDRPVVAAFTARVEAVEPRVARGQLRLTLAPAPSAALPPHIRVTIPMAGAPAGLAEGAAIALRARLTPPPPMALPGGHDFARDSWFRSIGAVGRALGPVVVERPGKAPPLAGLRDRLGQRVRSALPGASGGIATALATGDQSAVSEEAADIMRRSGLAHLLSVSGLHIAAMVGAAMVLTLRLLALSPALALRFNLVLVAAAVGAAAGIGYTLLTGMQVPTVRSCIAALLVLAGIALGREALSMRLVAFGALVILAFRPEALLGASFQMSFAAVVTIVTLYRHPKVRALLQPRGGALDRVARGGLGLLLTGLAVELALLPIGLFHFHKAGLYGVLANLVAIPLTTFVTMPAETLALLLDPIGLSAPFWWATGLSIDAMLALGAAVASSEGAMATLPILPGWAFAAAIAGGLWLCLWDTRWRWLGALPIAATLAAAATLEAPDLLVSGDGRHLAVVERDGQPRLLRARAGRFVRDSFAEAAGFDGDGAPLAEAPFARCGPDSCVALIEREGRAWRLLATRSGYRIDWAALVDACRQADIVVSDRRLPRACQPRWLRLDRAELARRGGVALYLGKPPRLDEVAARVRGQPWAAPEMDLARPADPALSFGRR